MRCASFRVAISCVRVWTPCADLAVGIALDDADVAHLGNSGQRRRRRWALLDLIAERGGRADLDPRPAAEKSRGTRGRVRCAYAMLALTLRWCFPASSMFIAAASVARSARENVMSAASTTQRLALDAVVRQRLDQRPLGLHLVVPVHGRGVAEDVGAAGGADEDEEVAGPRRRRVRAVVCRIESTLTASTTASTRTTTRPYPPRPSPTRSARPPRTGSCAPPRCSPPPVKSGLPKLHDARAERHDAPGARPCDRAPF